MGWFFVILAILFPEQMRTAFGCVVGLLIALLFLAVVCVVAAGLGTI
ncbi:MAG TPA: hypothetical protein VFE94_00285 [Candidatus Paceibacterota bacterium]|nr:hypothetical protein [Candidatus Paceibacterota bacterium]